MASFTSTLAAGLLVWAAIPEISQAQITVGGNGSSTTDSTSYSGTNGLTKIGTNTVTLSGNNTYTGGTIVNGGTLALTGSLTNSASAAITVNNGGTFSIAKDNFTGGHLDTVLFPITINAGGQVTGGTFLNTIGALNLNGGTITSAGGNSFWGNLAFVLKGTVTAAGNATSTIGGSGAMMLGGGAVNSITFSVADGLADTDLLVSAVLDNGATASWPNRQASSLVKTGDGKMVLAANNTYSGTTTISGGTLQVGNGGSAGALGSGNVTNNATLAVNRNNAYTLANTISGTGSLVQAGSGITTLSGINTYTGGTTVTGGVLRATSESQLGASNGAVTLNGGQLGNNNSDLSLNSTRAVTLGASGGFLEAGWNRSITVAGQIGGTGGLGVVWNAGTVILSGSNTYAGATTIGTTGNSFFDNSASTPTLRLGNANALPSTGLLVFGTNAQNNTATLDLNGFSASVGGLSGSGNARITSGVGGAVTLTTAPTNGTATFAGIIGNGSGTVSLVKTGSGTQTLSGNNTFSGGTIVNGGTLALSNNNVNVLSGPVTVNSGATLRAQGVNIISDTSAMTLNGGTYAMGTNGDYIASLTMNGNSTVSGTPGVGGAQFILTAGQATNSTIKTLTATGANNLVQANIGISSQFGGVGGNANLNFNVVNAADSLTVSGVIADKAFDGGGNATSGAITKSGQGTLILTGDNTYTGGASILAGTVQVGNGGTTGNITGNAAAILNNGTLIINRADGFGLGNAISGTGRVMQSGSGTTTVTGVNTYTGGTLINAGTLNLAGGSSTGGNFTIGNGATLLVTATNNANQQYSFNGTPSFAFTTNGGGTIDIFSGANFIMGGNGTFTSAGGAQNLIKGSTGINLSSFISTFNVARGTDASSDLLVSGTFWNSGGITKAGNGIMTLTGTNTYSGTTTISGGTLQVGNGGTSGTLGSGNVVNNSTLVFNRSDAATVGNSISGSGTLIQAGAGTTTVSFNNVTSFSGNTVVSSGGLAFTGSALNRNTVWSGAGISNAGTISLTVANNDALFLNQAISGNGNWIINAATAGSDPYKNRVTFTGSNSVNGGTITVTNNGNLWVQGGGSVGSNTVINLSGSTTRMYVYGPDLPAIAGLNGNGAVDFYDGGGGRALNLSVGAGNASSLFSGSMGNSGVVSGSTTLSLTKLGSGTFTLAGANTYSGTTTISGGLLQIGNGGASGTLGSGNVVNNATLAFNRSNNISVGNTISGTGTLVQAGTGTTTLSFNNVTGFSGNTVVSSGGLAFTGSALNSNTVWSGAGISNAGTISLTVANNDALFLNQAISGNGNWIINAATAGSDPYKNRVIFTGANSVNGGTITVTNNGNLWIQGGGSVGSNTVINLSGSATRMYVYGPDLPAIAGLNGNGAVDFYDGGGGKTLTLSVGVGNVSSLFSGSMGNSGTAFGPTTLGLTKVGSGTFTLAGANTYTGGTTINGGTLAIGANNRLADSGAVTVSGGTFDLGGFSDTVGAVTMSSGAINNGTLTGSSYDVQSGSVSAALAGSGALAKNGAGTVNLSGANTFTGGTTVHGGTLATTAGERLADGGLVTVNTGGTLALGGDETVAGLAGSGAVQLGGRLITGSTNSAFSGVMSGTGGLTKNGAGSFTLSGANTYTGDTILNGGTLVLASSNALWRGGVVTLTNGTTLTVNQRTFIGALDQFGGTINGAGELVSTLTKTDSGSLNAVIADGPDFAAGILKRTTGTTTVGAANTFTGVINLQGGTLQLGTGGSFAAGSSLALHAGTTMSLNNKLQTFSAVNGAGGTVALGSGALTVSGSDDSDFGGTITGTGSFAKGGAGTMTLSGANTYSGTTTVSGGTLIVASGGSISTNSVATVGAGAHLKVNGTAGSVSVSGTLSGSGTVGAVTLSSGGTLAAGNSPGLLTASSATWNVGSSFAFEISDALGTAGTDWDLFSVTGQLSLGGISSASKMTLLVSSIDLQNYDVDTEYTWVFARAASLAGTESWAGGLDVTDRFSIDGTGFNGGAQPGSGFQVVTGTDGGYATLSLRAVPEPGSASLVALGLVTLLLRKRRCRR